MTGVKGKRGGARIGTGGAQPGAGRPIRHIHLDKETARELKTLVRVHPGTLNEHQLVANLIHEAHAALDTDAQRRADTQAGE